MSKALLETTSLPEFFRDQVVSSIKTCRVAASPHAEFYLVNLLLHFTHSERLFDRSEDGAVCDKALALQLFDATMAGRFERISLLKRLGDVALYVSGFFGDSLCQKVVGVDYYINMGHAAYSNLSGTDAIFAELAENFVSYVDVLADIASQSSLRNDNDLLKLYERWLKTQSKKDRELLKQQGIIATTEVKSPYTQ